MKIYIDVDNTICYTNDTDYSKSTPNLDNIKKVNELFENNIIIMWTARGTISEINWFDVTYNQLKKWNVNFHELRMGKPNFDILIDDRVLNSIYHWNDRNQLAIDFKFLDLIYEEVLKNLSDKLNSIHKTNFSKRYWRIL